MIAVKCTEGLYITSY